MLLFVIGLEIKPSRLWSLRRDLLGLGSLQILLTGFAITFYVSLGSDSWRTALLIGLSLSLSSTAFVMQLLREKGEFASRHGTGAFAVLLAQDLSVVPLLALVPLLSAAYWGLATDGWRRCSRLCLRPRRCSRNDRLIAYSYCLHLGCLLVKSDRIINVLEFYSVWRATVPNDPRVPLPQ